MTIYKSRKIRKALLKKGFKSSTNDHDLFIYIYKGQVTDIWTCISFGPNHDIDDNLISKMKRQIHLEKEEFCNLVECTLDKTGLERIYENRNIVRYNKLDVE